MKPDDSREVRADARDVRADARDVRADITDTELQDRGVRADVREDVVTEREGSVVGSIRLLKWLICVLIVISAGNFIRTFVNQNATDKSTMAARNAEEAAHRAQEISIESREAALDTLQELRAVVARAQANSADQPELANQAILEALQSIARIEGYLCGGPCPESG